MKRSKIYLKDPANSLVREELFNYRLFYDLKKAAIEREYHLKIFSATVDFEGYDIVIDDNNKIGRFQIKTRFEAKTSVWNIQKGMLLPRQRNADLMRFDNGLCTENDNGVILIDIKSSLSKKEDYHVDYYYTDFYIIKSIATKLIPRSQIIIDNANHIIEQLVLTKNSNSKIKISKYLFVKIKNPSCLLAICGFDSLENKQIEALAMKLFENNKIRIKDIDCNMDFLADKKAFIHEINELIINN